MAAKGLASMEPASAAPALGSCPSPPDPLRFEGPGPRPSPPAGAAGTVVVRPQSGEPGRQRLVARPGGAGPAGGLPGLDPGQPHLSAAAGRSRGHDLDGAHWPGGPWPLSALPGGAGLAGAGAGAGGLPAARGAAPAAICWRASAGGGGAVALDPRTIAGGQRAARDADGWPVLRPAAGARGAGPVGAPAQSAHLPLAAPAGQPDAAAGLAARRIAGLDRLRRRAWRSPRRKTGAGWRRVAGRIGAAIRGGDGPTSGRLGADVTIARRGVPGRKVVKTMWRHGFTSCLPALAPIRLARFMHPAVGHLRFASPHQPIRPRTDRQPGGFP